MKRESSGPILTAVFVDYDNVYLSLKRKSEDAAKRFSKDAGAWLKEIINGSLMTATNAPKAEAERRLVICRCYGNPVPRRNQNDNSTDMSSFPFVRHHFLRAGFEVVDCPPLTAQLKNSADIRMVMDVRDILTHETRFDEFVILSADADFTPVLHRLRSHARRTVIYSNDHTAAPYTAICDAEIREADFLALLTDGNRIADQSEAQQQRGGQQALPSAASIEAVRKEILTEVANIVRTADQPVPLEALADRCVRVLGHEKTAGSAWGGTGSFRDLLSRGLPEDIRLTAQPPYFVYDANRAAQASAPRIESRAVEQPRAEMQPRTEMPTPAQQPRMDTRMAPRAEMPVAAPARNEDLMAQRSLAPFFGPQQTNHRQVVTAADYPNPMEQPQPMTPAQPETLTGQPGAFRQPLQPQHVPQPQQPPAQHQHAPMSPRTAQGAASIQQSIARIHEASQAPTLSPQDYRTLFDVMAQEISANGLAGQQTLANIVKRAEGAGIGVRRDDVRFVLDVVSEADPWFDQGASPSLFASRFRNFVVARCRSQGLNLSADELDLIEAWFAAPVAAQSQQRQRVPQQQDAYAPNWQQQPGMPQSPQAGMMDPSGQQGDPNQRWWGNEETGQATGTGGDDFPRIIRTRLRG